MKILQSSIFRAVCALVVGILLIYNPQNTVTGITIAIGVLFFLSGVISLVSYYAERRHTTDVEVYDSEGNQIAGAKPSFPIVGLGSLVLGLILALMPNTFVAILMYLLAAILILGALNQFLNLSQLSKIAHVPFSFWISPSLILLVAIIAILYPNDVAAAPVSILGCCMVLYGIVECVNAIKIQHERKQYEKMTQKPEEPEQDTPDL